MAENFSCKASFCRGQLVRLHCADMVKDTGKPRKWLIVGVTLRYGDATANDKPAVEYIIRSVQPAYSGEAPVQMGVSALEIAHYDDN